MNLARAMAFGIGAILMVVLQFFGQATALDCNAILYQIINGGTGYANYQHVLALKETYNHNCLGAHPSDLPQRYGPRPIPQPEAPPPEPSPAEDYNNALTQAIAAENEYFGRLVMRGAPLPQNVPLSSGTQMMQNVTAPPPAPATFVDKFAPLTQTPGSGPAKLNSNLGDIKTLQPPAASNPAAPPPSQPWANPFPQTCTFNSPSCPMGPAAR
jgi:hypothetical protein